MLIKNKRTRINLLASIILLIIFSLISFSSALMPSPTTIEPHWALTKYDGNQSLYFNTDATKINSTDYKICVYPKVTMRENDQRWLLLAGNLTKNDRRDLIKTISLSDLVLTKSGQNVISACLNISSTIADRLQLGSSTIVYEWEGNTLLVYDTDLYERSGYEIKVYSNGDQIQVPDLKWVEVADSNPQIFFPNVTGVTYPLSEVTFRVNKFEEEQCSTVGYVINCVGSRLDFTDFRAKNNITSETITELYGTNATTWVLFRDWFLGLFGVEPIAEEYFVGYDLRFEGTIVDLDPTIYIFESTINPSVTYNVSVEANSASHLNISTTAPYNSLISYYPFDIDGQPYWWKFGKINNSYEFDRTNDYINTTMRNTLNNTPEFSMSVWVYYDAPLRDYNTILYSRGSANRLFGLSTTIASSKQFTFYYNNDTATAALTSTTLIDTGRWYHLVGTYKVGEQARLYVNGVLDKNASAYATGNVTHEDWLLIGSDDVTANRYWDGRLDEIKIWNRSLSATEVSDIYSKENNNLIEFNSTGLVARYPLDDYKYNGERTADVSGNNYNGTLTNFALTAYDLAGSNDLTYTGTSTVNSSGIYDDYATTYGVTSSYLTRSFTSGLTGTYNMSVCAWIRPSSVQPTSGAIIAHDSAWALRVNGTSGATTGVYFYTNPNTTASIAVPTNTWSFVCGVKNETHISLTVNAVTTTSLACTANLSAGASSNHYIGYYGCCSLLYNGSVDEVMIFNTTLNSTQISDIYNNKSARFFNTGTQEFTQQSVRINSTNNYINYSNPFFDKDFGSNLTMRLNYWNVTYGYNDSSTGYTNESLVAYYHADSISNNTRYVSGKVGNALSFNGVDELVDIPLVSSNLNMTVNYTLSAWIYPTSNASVGMIIKRGGDLIDDSVQQYNLRRNTNGTITLLKYNTTAANSVTTTAIVPNNQWTHVMGIVNSTNMMIYINGTLSVIGTNPSLVGYVTDTEQYIGSGKKAGVASLFNGSIDQVRIWNRTLSDAEISSIYNSESTGTVDPTMNRAGLVAEWLFDLNQISNYGNIVPDSADNNIGILIPFNKMNITDHSGQGNHGNITGTASVLNSGMFGQGLTLPNYNNGDAGWVSLPLSQATNFTRNYTLSAWIYPVGTTPGVVNTIIKRGTDAIGAAGTQYAIVRATTNLINVYIANSTTSQTIASNQYLTPNTWYHVLLNVDNTNASIYINGQLDKSSAITVLADTYPNSTVMFIGNARTTASSLTEFFNGTIDELMIFNRSLSADEVKELYVKGRYSNVGVNWQQTETQEVNSINSFDTQDTVITNLYPEYTFTSGTNSFYTSYLVYGGVLSGDTLAPTVNFISQSPADANSSNLLVTGLNMTFNITAGSPYQTLVSDSIKLYYKLNSSTSEINYFINGTLSTGYLDSGKTYTNVSNNYTWNLDDHDVYPATYNIDPNYAEGASSVSYNMTNANNYIKTKLFNVTNSTQFNFLEISVVNRTTTTTPLRIYYCNSSYTSGAVTTNTNCVEFATLDASTPPNHIHTAGEYDYVISFPITNGSVSGIKVTDTSYFLLRGTTSPTANWNVNYLTNVTRADQVQTTTSGGTTWSNFVGTTLIHLHQFRNDTGIWYYACANNTANKQTCSTPRNDIYQQGGLPPSAPNVYAPVEGTQEAGNIVINYTASVSPNSYEIIQYNISLLNADLTFNQTIIANNSPNLGYVWVPPAGVFGEFVVAVEAKDSLGQTATGYSENFTRLADITKPTIQFVSPTDTSGSLKAGNLIANVTGDDLNWANMTLNVYYSNGTLYYTNTSTSKSTYYSVNSFANGLYYFNATATDLYGNTNSTETRNVTIDNTAPTISILSPISGGLYVGTTDLNVSITDTNGVSATWWTTNGINITYFTGNTTFSLSEVGIITLYVYANDTLNNTNYSQVTFNYIERVTYAVNCSPGYVQVLLNNGTAICNEIEINETQLSWIDNVLNLNMTWLTNFFGGVYCALTGCVMQGDIQFNNSAINNTNYVQFNTTWANGSNEGRLQWNSEDGTLEVGMPGGNVNLQIGQENLLRVTNDEGFEILNGQVVYISGGSGNNVLVKLADADVANYSHNTIGIATENIASGQKGYITAFGLVRNINTSLYTPGTLLYLSSTAGGYTDTVPPAPAHTVQVGHVVRQHATAGSILVGITVGEHLDQLDDVLINSPQEGQVIMFNATSGLWYNANYTAYNDTWINQTFYNKTEIDTLIQNFTTNESALLYVNSTGLIRDWNASGYIKDWNESGWIINWNASGLILNWSAIITVPEYTHLSNFTDDLGNRGYTHLSNFTNDLGIGNWSADKSNYYTKGEVDGLISGINGSISNITISGEVVCNFDIFGYYNPNLPSIKTYGCRNVKW